MLDRLRGTRAAPRPRATHVRHRLAHMAQSRHGEPSDCDPGSRRALPRHGGAIQPTGPYRMFGYEEGAILVFELALQLQAKGEEIAFLGMFDAPRVGPPQRRSWTRLIRYHGRMLSQLPLAGWWPHLYHHIFQHRLTRMFTKLALRLAQYRPAPPPPVQQAKQPVVGQNTSLIQWLRILASTSPIDFVDDWLSSSARFSPRLRAGSGLG